MDFGKMPVGFAMAPAQNQAAMQRFGTMSESERQSVFSQAHVVRSEQEIHQLVSTLGSTAFH